MRFSLFALLAGAAACSSYSTTNVIAPDDDGFAGATSLTSKASEQGGASATASSSATATTAVQLATGGAVSAGGAAVAATGGTSAFYSSTSKAFATGGRSTASGGATSLPKTAGSGGASTVLSSKNSTQCSAWYKPCADEPTCTDYVVVTHGDCRVASFVCGKYSGWVFDNGTEFMGEIGTSSAARAFIDYSDYLTKNCGGSGTGGATGAGGSSSAGGAVSFGGTSISNASTTKSTQVADCSAKSTELPCKYHNDPSDPSKCIGEPLPNVTTCKSYLTAACNEAYGGQGCWYACSECALWGSDSPKCGKALESIPRDVSSCSSLYPEN